MLDLMRRISLLGLAALLVDSVALRCQAQSATDARQPSNVALAIASGSVLAHLQRADALLEAEQWQDAAEILRGVMEEHDDSMMRVGPRRADGFQRYVPLAEYCQMQLARLAKTAPESLVYYRRTVDAGVQRAKREAEAKLDAAALTGIAERFFVASTTDDVLLRLGDLEVERGNWTAARRNYEAIHRAARFSSLVGEDDRWNGWPIWLVSRKLQKEEQWQAAFPRLKNPAGLPSWLVYPDSQYEASLVIARLVLVSIIEGNTVRARMELELLRRLDANARGRLAGRDGKYVETLEELLAASDSWPETPSDTDWLTLGGGPTRQRIADRYTDETDEPTLGESPRWKAMLPRRSADGEHFSGEGQRVAEPIDALLSYHPIVVGKQLIVQTGNEQGAIASYDLHNGTLLFGHTDANVSAEESEQRNQSVRRFSLSATDSRVFARLSADFADNRESRIVGLDLVSQGKLSLDRTLDRERWGPEWAFDGVPLVANHRLFVTLRRQDTVHSEIHVACFDELYGDLLWSQEICSGRTLGEGRQPYPAQTLLTWSEDTIFCNTHLGVIAALRASDGRVRWLCEYPRISPENENPDRNDQHVFRDLTPCLAYRGLVIAAPCDCNRLFALDANTGHVIWTSLPEQAADAIHLLGVGGNNLIVSGDYLYWLDVYTGRIVGQFPPPRRTTPGHARPSPRGHGRGVLVGDNVYWPTRNSIFVFGQRTVRTELGVEPHFVREIKLTPRGATGGNLVVARNVLVIAAADKLFVFDRYGQRNTDEIR
ncbi:MAG: hypothetical protein CMJ64_05265 [Planctomycetaceae bacterium]|nr:hypothetical protein [Planctomycetaceae bacterium]